MKKKKENEALFKLTTSAHCILLEGLDFFSLQLPGRKTEKDRGRRLKSGLCPHMAWKKKMFLRDRVSSATQFCVCHPSNWNIHYTIWVYSVSWYPLWTHKVTRTCSPHLVWRNKKTKSLTFLPLPLCPLLLPPRTLAGPPSSDIHLYFANITTGLPSEDGITIHFQFE